jgi:signal transduction histidine kinase
MTPASDYLVTFWLRTVRMGLLVTGLVLVALVVYPLLPGHGVIDPAPYVGILVAALVGGVVVSMLPWRRLFERGVGTWFLYAWSAADIVLISLAVLVTGGPHSNSFLLYFLTTVFFNVSYPVRGQVALLLFTFAAYIGTLALAGWEIAAGTLFLRLVSLGILAVIAGFAAFELMRRMEDRSNAAAEAERWAALLATVTSASRRMTLDRDHVVNVVLESVLELGFEASELCAIDPDERSYRVVEALGMPPEYGREPYPIHGGMVGRVFGSGRTESVEDYSADPGSLPLASRQGFRRVAATPVWVEGWLAAVLVGGTRERRELGRQEVQALELLAAQTGLALENANRFQEQSETVERLAELDRLKSDFLATVSHELRTPVTVIEGVGLTLERTWSGLDDATRAQMLAGLNANARSLDSIITTLLDFSRLESGNPDVRLEEVDVTGVVESTAERLRHLLRQRRLDLSVDRGLRAWADPTLLERILENLLSNAAKHTPEGTLVVVWAQRQQGQVLLAVSDDGPGIPPDELAHLGERFFRGGDLNTRPKGLGLGLALVRDMLALQNSELEVESSVGAGSRFWFSLPAAVTAPPREADAGGGRDGRRSRAGAVGEAEGAGDEAAAYASRTSASSQGGVDTRARARPGTAT